MPNSDKYRILSTKSLQESLRQAAATRGIALVDQPFIDILPVRTPQLDARLKEIALGGQVLVFTSPNTVKSVTGYWNNGVKQRIYCLGGATLEVVQAEIPGAEVLATAASSLELAKLIVSDASIGKVVFLCGNIRRNELPEHLSAHQIGVEELVVYHTVETPALLGERYDGVLFFSPSSVRSFFQQNTPDGETVYFAIGETTGAAVQEITGRQPVIGTEASVPALVQTAIDYFDNINNSNE